MVRSLKGKIGTDDIDGPCNGSCLTTASATAPVQAQ